MCCNLMKGFSGSEHVLGKLYDVNEKQKFVFLVMGQMTGGSSDVIEMAFILFI